MRNPLFGIAISSRNRPDILAQCLKGYRKHTPDTAPIVVVDDASDKPIDGADYRFDQRAGIPRVKNKGIEILMDHGVEWLILSDDDIWPVVDDWWRPYTESPERYASYTFTHWSDGTPVGDADVVYDDGVICGLTWERGCVLVYHRSVIERVGGMWTGFGPGFWDHVELATRIHNAGLSTFRFQDIADSDRLWHSLDRQRTAPRSFSKAERDHLMARNTPLADARKHFSEYVEYRERHNLVLSCLFTGVPDTQRRNKTLPADPVLAKVMLGSVRGADTAVLHNQCPEQPGWIRVPDPQIPVYFQRWLSYAQYLRSHPDIRWVWCVDATDTEMLHEPWQWMHSGRLYIGHEPDTVSKPWLTQYHPVAAGFVNENPNRQLLNAGVVGGDRQTVIDWCQALTDWYFQHTTDCGIGDMAAIQMVAYSDRWRDRIEYGSHIATVFRANERDARSWWKHK